MKTWQFVLGFTVVGLVVVQFLTPNTPEAGAPIVQKIEETEQVDGGIRAIVRMRSAGGEAHDVDAVGDQIADILEDLQDSGKRYNEVVFAVEAPTNSGDYFQAFSVFYDSGKAEGVDLARAHSRDVFDAGEPAIITPLGKPMLAKYCRVAQANDRRFCRMAME